MLLVYITDYLKSGENVLVVGAYDPNDGRAASGKNGSRGDYIFTSGIWQTVWLEPVEKQYISQIKLVPDLKNNRLEVIAYTEDKIGIAVVDALTGDFYVTEVSDTKKLNDEIVKFSPSEKTSYRKTGNIGNSKVGTV